MRIITRLICATLLLAVGVACHSERAQLNKIDINLKFYRFEQDLFTLNKHNALEQITHLQQQYPVFFPLFSAGILRIGQPVPDTTYSASLLAFVTDTMVLRGYTDAQALFAHDQVLRDKLTLAFKRYRLHFPADSIPAIYTYVSGFNQSIMIAEGMIGIGLDKYLGEGYPLYTQMGFYKYMQRNMVPARVPVEVMQAQAIARYPDNSTDLLSRMIWEGKVLYLAKRMLPSEPDTLHFGFTKDQLVSCLNNERYMWDYLVQNKLLFSTQARVIREFTQEAPFTPSFSRQSPGKAVNWIGYRIVEGYMQHNKHTTLPQLMEITNAVQLLEGAKYSPK